MGFAPACSSRRVEKTPLTQRPTAVSSPSASPPALVEARLMFEVLRADTRRTTAQGTSFVAPKDWRIAIRGGATLLEPPEAGSRMALVDTDATNADAAGGARRAPLGAAGGQLEVGSARWGGG